MTLSHDNSTININKTANITKKNSDQIKHLFKVVQYAELNTAKITTN